MVVSHRCPAHDAISLSRADRRSSRRLLRAALGTSIPRWLRVTLASMVMCQALGGGGAAVVALVEDSTRPR